jgi:hypothetical protein
MPDEPNERPTQETEKGLTIPVPTRDEIDKALAAVAKPDVEESRRRKRRTKKQ